ncbi:uncharacterized protein PG998_012232 [Apiospora kogelbergensis]|uniref:Uncharacterized protein n=1 Tax=Apiospora kogelbergensis TaxID=1337665 RepID=A0AAW0QMM9_9PEZI
MYFNQAIAIAILAYTAAAAPAGSATTCADRDSVCRKYTANNGLSSVECDVAIAQCIGSCQVSHDRCSTAPDANHATCVASLVGCTGKSVSESLKPQSATGEALTFPAQSKAAADSSCVLKDDACRTAPGANMAECSAQKAECKDQCSSAADACRTAPGANQSLCSADYAKCLGENPYAKRAEEPHWETGDAVYFPAKNAKTAEEPHWETGDAVYFPAQSKAAATSCILKDDACRTAPDANMSLCNAEKAACKTVCQADADACRTAPGANQSLCSADFAKCLGENPYAKKRATEEPHWETGDAVYFPAKNAVKAAAEEPHFELGTPVYQGNCQQLDDKCRTAPGANMSLCNAEKAECKATCVKESDACRSAPSANQAECSAKYASCLGTNPYN